MEVPEKIGAALESTAQRLRPNRWDSCLIAKASADRDTLASGGATAAEHCCAAFGFHARAKTVLLYAAAAVGLKCALGH